MERLRRRRGAHARVSSPLKVTTIVDQSSKDWNIQTQAQGKEVVGKQNKLQRSGSYSSTCSSGITTLEENQLSFDTERSSTELPGGTTMKKLLADELAKETESGRRSPSIIARLMGLDGLPVPHSSSKKQKKFNDNHQRGSGSAGFSKIVKLHDSQSHKKNAKGQQHFKDVFEVVDRSNIETSGSTSRGASSRNFCEEEIDFIRQKFMDAKRFSTDEKLQHSKEFHDALEVLDSNKDLLLKFLQEPDSLFSKHLYDLHNAPESCYGCNQGTASNDALKCNIDVIGCQSGSEDSQKIDISHSHKRWSSCYCSIYDSHSREFEKSSFSAEGNEDASSNPTKIVVLKPNLGRALGINKSAPSNTSIRPQSDSELYNECPNPKHHGSEVRDKRTKKYDFDIYGRTTREPRELAREITRRMRNRLGVDYSNVSSSGFKGYSADESSHDTSENDSSSESEVTTVRAQTSSNRRMHNKDSTLGFMESSVNIEAKKRLTERWKMSHRSQENGASDKGSTLGEMLAIPDAEIRLRSPDTAVPQDCPHRFGRNEGTAKLNTPLGISSRDGWKDGCSQNLSRSRSLPASANHLGSPKSSIKREAIAAERFPIQKESNGHAKNKGNKRNSRRKDGSFPESRKPSDDGYEKSQSSCPSVEMVDDVYEIQCNHNHNKKNTTDTKDSPEVKSVILEMSSCRQDTQFTLNAHDVKEQKYFSKNESEFEISSCALPQDGSSTSDMPSMPQIGGSSCLQCAATHAESLASSKESEQPSPVSVLEAPFVEDPSSGSECFERVSAELLGEYLVEKATSAP
ncbi:Ubiquitin carboxyl-terminal hydrolase 19 [Bienertia sinuspersici]